MTTITIETEGQPPIVITVGHSNTMTVSKKDYLTHPQPHPLSPPAHALPSTSPTAASPSGWKNYLRNYAPGVALGVIAAIVIIGSRPAQIPTPMMQDPGNTIPQQPMLPPLSGGPIGASSPSGGYGPDGQEGPRSVNETVRDTQRAIASDRIGLPQQRPDGTGPTGAGLNQGGAPTAGVAPTIKGAPVVGLPQPGSSDTSSKSNSPFGLEP